MAALSSYADAERVIAHILGGLGDVGGETPPDLADHLPFLRVRRIGGADNRVTDLPRVDVRVYAPDRSAALHIAEQARQRLTSMPVATPHGVLDRADTESGPAEVPGPDPETYRVANLTVRASLRRRR